MIGTNSITRNLFITNRKGNPFEVIVQANKHYGICDIILPEDCKDVRSIVLNCVIGRQINNSETLPLLSELLYITLNED